MIWLLTSENESSIKLSKILDSHKIFHATTIEKVVKLFNKHKKLVVPTSLGQIDALNQSNIPYNKDFVDTSYMTVSNYLQIFGFDYLNSDVEFSSVDKLDYLINLVAGKYSIFSKGGNDLENLVLFCRLNNKTNISGSVIISSFINEWFTENLWKIECDNCVDNDLDNLEVCLSSQKNISAEYRIFVVENRVITGSQYKHYNRPKIENIDNNYSIMNFATRLAKYWPYNRSYSMDIAELYSGDYRVVSINPFSCSEFYNSNLNTLVTAMDRYLRPVKC